jgi:SAM-dependent methyltransferase
MANATMNLDRSIFLAMYRCMAIDLGVSSDVAGIRSRQEAEGDIYIGRVDELTLDLGELPGKTILDIGAGLGGLSAELAKRGAKVIALEPARDRCALISQRLRDQAAAIAAVGEAIPLADSSVDHIVSLQVLEHVRNPRQVIREAYRVLKPGGCFFASYENYLGFREPHYRVRWLPLLPKRLGAAYLRCRGRDPQFLLQSVTYTTFPSVRRAFLSTGFTCLRRKGYGASLATKKTWKWRLLRCLPNALAQKLVALFDYLRRLFRTGIEELMQKPVQ